MSISKESVLANKKIIEVGVYRKKKKYWVLRTLPKDRKAIKQPHLSKHQKEIFF